MYPPSVSKSCSSFTSLRARNKAFTLIELLMVMAVIGLLAGITFGISKGVRDSQARAKAKGELAILSQALEEFKGKNGDYPWTTSGGTIEANGRVLFQSLVGWMKFRRLGGTTLFEMKQGDEIPGDGGPAPYVDISKLSYAAVGDLDEDTGPSEHNPDINMAVAPTNYVFVDPWGKPYVFIHAQTNSRTWEVFGYHLYTTGPDKEESTAGLNITTGDLTDAYRDEEENLDNIYVGE